MPESNTTLTVFQEGKLEKLIAFIKDQEPTALATILDNLLADRIEILHYDDNINVVKFAHEYNVIRQLRTHIQNMA